MFSTTDPAEHARIKRPVAKYYSSSNVLALESHMDEILDDLCRRLESGFANGPKRGTDCDLGDWIAYCSCRAPLSLQVMSAWLSVPLLMPNHPQVPGT